MAIPALAKDIQRHIDMCKQKMEEFDRKNPTIHATYSIALSNLMIAYATLYTIKK